MRFLFYTHKSDKDNTRYQVKGFKRETIGFRSWRWQFKTFFPIIAICSNLTSRLHFDSLILVRMNAHHCI